MSGPDRVEIFMQDKLLVQLESSHAPDRGDTINIRQKNYKVIGRTFTVDYADSISQRQINCIVNVEPTK